MPSDKPVSDQDIFTKPANGKTAGSYRTDGTWNRGGWATYPSADELALNAAERPPAANKSDASK